MRYFLIYCRNGEFRIRSFRELKHAGAEFRKVNESEQYGPPIWSLILGVQPNGNYTTASILEFKGVMT